MFVTEIIDLEKGNADTYVDPYSQSFEDSPIAVLGWYKSQGWNGTAHGSAINIMVSLLSVRNLDLEKHNPHYFPTWQSQSKVFAENQISKRLKDIELITREEVINNYLTWQKDMLACKRSCVHPYIDLTEDIVIALSDKKYRSSFVLLAKYIVSEREKEQSNNHRKPNYGRGGGWPEIIIIKEGVIKLVKVRNVWKSTASMRRFQEIYDGCLSLVKFDIVLAEMPKNPALSNSNNIRTNTINLKMHKENGKRMWQSPVTKGNVCVEQAVLDYYKAQGWSGLFCENMAFQLLINSIGNSPLCLSCLTSETYGPLEDDQSPCNDMAAYEKHLDLITSDEVRRNCKALLRDTHFRPLMQVFLDSGLDENFIAALYRGIVYGQPGKRAILEILKKYDQCGWPDLILYNEEKIKFVEVKAPGDKLRPEQEMLIRNQLIPLGFDVELVLCKPDKTNQIPG